MPHFGVFIYLRNEGFWFISWRPMSLLPRTSSARKIMVRSLHQNTYQPRWLSVSRCKKWSIFPSPYLNSFWRTIDVEDVEVLLRGEHDVPTLLRSSRNASVKKCYFLHLVNPNLLCESASTQHDLTMILRAEVLRGQRWVFQADPMAKQPEIGGRATCFLVKP